MIEKFTNMFKIPELRNKLLITLGLLAVCRLGVFIPMPGIDTTVLKTYFQQFTQSGVGQLLGLVDLFAGGAMSSGAIFGLGIMPYISASIIFQLLVGVVPFLERLQKEGDAGRKKINQYTRLTTVGLCLFQAFIMIRTLYAIEINGVPVVPIHIQGIQFQIMAAVLLTTGTVLLMWIGEQIDAHGIGSGISLIIMVGIIDRLPWAFSQILQNFTFSVAPNSEITVVDSYVSCDNSWSCVYYSRAEAYSCTAGETYKRQKSLRRTEAFPTSKSKSGGSYANNFCTITTDLSCRYN